MVRYFVCCYTEREREGREMVKPAGSCYNGVRQVREMVATEVEVTCVSVASFSSAERARSR